MPVIINNKCVRQTDSSNIKRLKNRFSPSVKEKNKKKITV